MVKSFLLKLKESFFLVLPITLVIYVLIICLGIANTENTIVLGISAILLIIGMSLFLIGADSSMSELGQSVGATLSKSRKIWLMVILSFVIGFIITFAEPDLMALATQVNNFSTLGSIWLFIATVSLGVGLFLVLAMFKIVFKWKLSIILTITYSLIFILAFFSPAQLMPIAFDSGGVTTGPISVPFLISFGLGLSAVRGNNNEEDCFGLTALCSTGPILAVLILSFFLGGDGVTTNIVQHPTVSQEFGAVLFGYVKDIAVVILPLVIIFIVFQIFAFKFPKRKVLKMSVGFIMTYIGIVLFLTGIECGYMNMGTLIGQAIASLPFNWIAIPIGILFGAMAILAEPALQVLKKQVEDITGGVIKQKVIVVVVAIGVAISVAIAVMQAMYGFNLLYILVPIYVISVGLSFFNTRLFTAVAFDSGGVASGTMAVSFILPLVTGLSSKGASGFGTVGLIAIFPVLSMQILGCIYKITLLRNKEEFKKSNKRRKVEIIEFDYSQYINDNASKKGYNH